MTERDLTVGMKTAAKADSLTPVLLVEFQFSGGTVNLWTGMGDIAWDDKTWTGTGYLAGVSAIEETSEIKANGIKYTLSGMTSATVAIALDQNYQGRPAYFWFGAMDTNNRLIADPYKFFSGKMDAMEITDDPDAVVITLSVENELIDLERPREFRYTPQDQRTYFPGDDFFNWVSALQEVELIWGRGQGPTVITPDPVM